MGVGSLTMLALGTRFFIAGGAGFIGSHFCDRLLGMTTTEKVTVFDNFSSGREWHFAHHKDDRRLSVVRGEIRDLASLTESIAGHDTVIHLASNPDIARAVSDPTIDMEQGTLLTNNVVEAMRLAGVPTIIYASGSGVYGDTGRTVANEDYAPMVPISTYGASKLAGEALISAYVHMFGLRGRAFRFGNVVGGRQTHGVGLDFVKRLRADPSCLRILGDGGQTKSYIHVEDVISGVLFAAETSPGPYGVFNLATGDTITVNEIADLACEAVGLDPARVRYDYTGGDRGWAGDVPIVLLDIDRIRRLGWPGARSSREAMRAALSRLVVEADMKLV
jgi:UDP-glucose 4-epimerase